MAARGIHVDDVSLVVHVDPPETHKDYLHRAGRTARAGAKGTVVSIASSGNRKRVHNLGKEAGVKMTETRIESRDNNLHPELMRITGAAEPSGVPVTEEVAPKRERTKPGRARNNRERREKPSREKSTRAKSAPKRREEKPKPHRDDLRRKDRAKKKFDKRIEKRVAIEKPIEKRVEKRIEKSSAGPNRIARRAHLQPEGRVVQTRSEKRKQKGGKNKPKSRSRSAR